MIGNHPIGGSIADPLEPAAIGNQLPQGKVYSRMIAFKLSQQEPELSLGARLELSKNGIVAITFDTDFDKNFDDEVPIVITDSSNAIFTSCDIGIPLQVNYPAHISRQTIRNLRWKPFICLSLGVNSEDSVYGKFGGAVYHDELLHGSSPLLDDSLCVIVQNKMLEVVYSNWRHPQVAIVPQLYQGTTGIKRAKYYSVGDTFSIGNSFFASSNYNGIEASIVLEAIDNNRILGSDVDFYVDTNRHYENISGRKASLVQKDKQFTLMEFWGTWCGPCVQLYPALDSMLTQYSSILHYQGVAFDKDDHLVKKYVKRKRRISNQVFVKMREPSAADETLVKNFKVKSFPTFLLIDGSGRIIARETGIVGFNKLRQYLQTRFY